MARSPILIAGIAVAALGAWLASGLLREDGSSAPVTAERTEPRAPLVEVVTSQARPVSRHIVAQGDVLAFRRAPARTQTEGRVDEILVSQGERVEMRQPLLRLTLEGRGSRLREARALLEQRQQDYDAAATLLEQGYTTAQRVRELRTQLESAREEVRRLEEEVGDTTVRAPFAGVVDEIGVEAGEYLVANAEVATLIDNSPLRIVVRVNQQNIARVEVGRPARVSYATGAEELGRVCFVSAAADPATRTFRVEIRTPNEGNAIPSGISAEARIPTGETNAHFVSPAILSLGTDGTLGLKTVGEDGAVAFHPVEVVRAQTDGIWVSGLPDEARIVTIGQGFVQAGDEVRVSEADESGFAGAEPASGAGDIPEEVGQSICERRPALPDDPSAEPVAAADPDPAPEGLDPEEGADEGDAPRDGASAPVDSGTVARVQRLLNGLGFQAGPTDGLRGDQTRQAVRAFQDQQGLPATGTLDQATVERVIELAEAAADAGDDT
ncbi:efflux RND transporter periplasmic adaptor subunit [Lutibaculum baratangense]|uniref:Membrane-fusion protein n=1 Tax=Lutibaculum baratangense AMV1 TaxID=631454 RepID=V4RNH2_9HYPH|nr:efflux RND transporter periplasmic adaptor subunit [Lutibaculum baratangense]ESR26824.1 Membrane-fusion protein [Lutibaculum baratangense AMV1]